MSAFAKRRVRVALVAPHYPEYTLKYAAALSACADVTVIVDEDQCKAEFGGRDRPPGHHAVHLARFEGPRDFLRMRRILNEAAPDVLHVQEAVGRRKALILLALASSAPRSMPLVMTVHDPKPHDGSDDRRAQRFATVKNRLRRKADVLVVHGDRCRAILPPTGNPCQTIFVSEHGVLLDEQFLPKSVSTPPRFLVFGRMEAYKGLATLLDACHALERSNVDYALTLAGRGPELDRLAPRFAALSSVTVIDGFIPPLQLMQLLGEAEAIVLPYTSATQSGVAAAAFGNGCYAVASAVGGLQDVVQDGDNGLLVAPGDAEALTGAMRRLVADPALRAHLMAGALDTARTRLSWATIADGVLTRCIEPLLASR